jgi:hypothetical protein
MKIIPIILGILISINLVYALNITSGVNESFIIPTSNSVFYEVLNNQSDIIGLSLYQNLNNITIVTDKRFKSDSFILILFEEVTNKEIEYISVGGSSGSSNTIYKNNTNTIYQTIKVPEYKEKIKEVPVEKITEIEKDKPFYKDTWFYIFLTLSLFIVIQLIRSIMPHTISETL